MTEAEYGEALAFAAALGDAGLRADVDAGSESLGKRMVRAREDAAAFLCVLGPRELSSGTVALRARAEDQARSLPRDAAVSALAAACERPPLHGPVPGSGA